METAYLDAIARLGLVALVVALLADWRFWRASAALTGLSRIVVTILAGYGASVLAVLVFAMLFERGGSVTDGARLVAIHGAVVVQIIAMLVLFNSSLKGRR